MTGAELHEALTALDMSQRQFARRFGQHETMVSRWIAGTHAVPRWVPPVIELLQRELNQ